MALTPEGYIHRSDYAVRRALTADLTAGRYLAVHNSNRAVARAANARRPRAERVRRPRMAWYGFGRPLASAV